MEIDDAVLTITEKEAAKIEWPIERQRLRFFWVGCLILFFVLSSRAFFLNVMQGAHYQDLSSRNSVRTVLIPAPRGVMYDRSGQALVHNIPSQDLILIPANAPRDREGQVRLAGELRALFQFAEEGGPEAVFEKVGIEENGSGWKSTDPVLLKERLTREEALLFYGRSKNFPGIEILKSATREYADGLIFSHILGYEGKIRKEELLDHPDYLLTDSIGKQGLEKSYEEHLRGIHGGTRAEVDAFGRIKKDLGIVAPEAGSDLVLHVDANLQKKIFDTMQTFLEKSNLKSGAAVALDPRTGGVLALVSFPGFDNNLFARGITSPEYQGLLSDPGKPLFNRAVAGEYPPGSTIKPFLAGAALTEGTITEHTQVESRGGISIGRFFFGDWKAHGFTDVRRAIAVSSDVFFYSIGGGYGAVEGLGMERMKKYETLFGFGAKTGIDLTGEADGLIPDPAWKQERFEERWYIGDDYHAAIGQGYVLATPLQLAAGMGALVNGGTLYRPQIVTQIKTADGEGITKQPEKVREHILAPDILHIVREGMRQTVTDGTAQVLKDLPVAVAGKTGTAQFGSEQKTHGWFESFAPYENPEIVLVILVEGQGEEGYNAVPITKEIYEWYFSREKKE